MRLCAGPWSALAFCVGLCVVYVGALYVRYDTSRSRDDPDIVLQRFVRVLAVSAVAPALLVAAFASGDVVDGCARSVVDAPLPVWLGLRFGGTCMAASLSSVGLTLVLYLGPLVAMDRDDWRELLEARLRPTLLNTRALLVGPLAEEMVFRASMCPALFAAGFSPAAAVGLSSVVFGLAHVHHRVDMRRRWLGVLAIFGYTTLFGAYSAYLFMRTGHLLPPLLAHSLCNLLGLPDFGAPARSARPRLVGGSFAVGICAFALLTTADAIWRPRLFDSVLWDEREPVRRAVLP
jgi:prenyl protein peptidase